LLKYKLIVNYFTFRFPLWIRIQVLLIIMLVVSFFNYGFSQACDPSTPTFTIDLTGAPDSTWVSPPVVRAGLCCAASGSDRCIEFIITLDPGSSGIQINLISGAIPPGALFYEIQCANPTQIGDTLCLDGVGPHRITFCKPGNNQNVYEIVSLKEPSVSPPITVSDGCQGLIYTTGYEESTIEWAPIPFNPTYLGYMSCTSGCDSVDIIVTGPGYPSFVDFEVSGYRKNTLCDTAKLRDTVRVYFVSDKLVDILPLNPVVCFGGVNTTITANASGGAPPYSYLWSTGETTQSIDVGVGTYWVEVFDTTNCPTVLDTVVVTAHLSPISVNAGANVSSCTNSPTATLFGSVNIASGGIWSGGNGTYSPSNSSLTLNYTPTPAEIIAGNVTLTLTTTGNGGCPAESDNVSIIIEPAPTIDAGLNQVVCGDIGVINLSGSFTNAGGVVWSGGNGTFGNPNNPNTTYIPVAADTAAGMITLTLTTINPGACNPVSDIVQITFTDIPTVNAGNNQNVCADVSSVSLAGSVTIATGGVWSTSGTGSFIPNANTLTANYIPSALDTASGNVTLTLVSTGNGNCNAYSDQMIINFYPAPKVNVGSDLTRCSDVGSISINPVTSNATSFSWTTSGSGAFSPNSTTQSVNYLPSNADTANGTVTLTLTVTSAGCGNYSDNLILTLTNAPTVFAGNDITTCKDISSIPLSGSVTTATGGIWTTNGSGTFSPSATNLSANYIPSAADITAGTVILTLTTTGNGQCNAYNDQVVITLTNIPTVNAGLDETICADASGVSLSGAVTIATGGVWSSNGTGNFSPSTSNLGATYVPSAADITAGTVTLTLTSTGNGLCQAYSDQMVITINPRPTVNAGIDRIVCGDIGSVGLNGNITNASGGVWTSTGTGSFSPNNTTLNANYIPSAADTANGSVTLTLTTTGNGLCNAYNDQMIITFTNAPTVFAGNDITTCKDISSISLSGSVTTATGGIWTTNGSGTFSPSATNLSANYIPSAADITAGTVILTLTTTGNGQCNAYNDQVVITLTNIPTVNAGLDETICADASGVSLSGAVTIATGGVWSSNGTGNFSPSTSNLGATYVPSAADITAGTVTLTLTSTGNGLCQAYSDQMVITINPRPTVNAGIDRIVCGDIGSVGLNGNITNASGGVWTSTGTGSFSPNNTTLNANYIPSAADTANGSVTLTLTTTGNGLCNAYNDQMIITFTNAPTVFAGNDITTCKDISSIPLSGSVTTATGGIWTTNGSGTFSPSATNLSANYIPSAADITAGTVILTLTTTGNGQCNAYNDQVVITLTNIPTVNAGLDETICADASGVSLSGAVTIATGGVWSSNGTGNFSPSTSNLGATYVPSAADITAGTVTLTLTSTGNGLCQAYSDQMVITINPRPTVNAGIDRIVCGDIGSVGLNGNITNASGGVWTSTGTGSFSPNNTTLNANYIPSAADTANGSVTLTLTTTGNGLCNAYNDQMIITFTNAPTVFAGNDITTCKDISSIPLSGSVTTATGGIWTTNGSGTFNPNSTTLSSSYIPSAADTTAGNVILTLTTTGNGQCNAYNDQLVITFTNIPVANAGGNQTVCADINGVSLSGGVQFASGGIWTTNGTGVFSPNNSTLNVTYIPSAIDTAVGSVTLTLTTSGNGSCQAYNNQSFITIDPAPKAFAGNDTSICITNPNVPLNGWVMNANGGVWSTSGSGTFIPSNTVMNPTYVTSAGDQAGGNIEIYLTTTGNGLCNAVRDTMIISITPLNITVFAGNDSLVCGDYSLALNGSFGGATGGIWTTLGDGHFGNDSTNLNANYYFGPNDTVANFVNLILTTTGNGGCLAQNDTIHIDIQDPLVLLLSALDSTCRNGEEFNVSSNTSTGAGLWSTSGDGTFANNNSLSTTYFFGSTDTSQIGTTLYFTTQNNGVCAAITDSIYVTYVDAPNVDFSFNLACLNDPTQFSDLSNAIGNLTSWNWTFDDTISSTVQNPSIIFEEYGTHIVQLMVESGYGCLDSITKTVIVHPLPQANFTENAQCYVDSVTIFDASTIALGNNVSYAWDVYNVATGSGPNITVAFDSAGTYTFQLIVTSDFGCLDTIIGSLDVRPNPVAVFNANQVCLNDTTNFVDQSTVEFGFIETWQWNFGNNHDSIQNPSNVFGTDGNHDVTLIVTSNIGCSDTIVQSIVINPLPNSDFSYQGFCEEDDVMFFDETTINLGSIDSWEWILGTTSSFEQNPTNGFGVQGNYNVTLITGSNFGCYDTITQSITISPNPTAEFSFSSGITQILDNVYFTDESIDATQWYWDFGDAIGYATNQNTSYAFNNFGQYEIQLIIENEFGCTDSVTYTITVKQPPLAPSGFSPNADGLNDVFNLLGGIFIEFQMDIYNNWGKVIFSTNDPELGWDGTHNGIDQPLGVYVYMFKVKTEDGVEYSGHGDVTLIR
jgi:gliding motility-associated-like protein